MKKIAVLYHSGVGSTRKIAEKIYNQLCESFDPELYSVEKLPQQFDANDFDGFVIGFPVIHTHPSKRILDFLNHIEKLSQPKAAFIFATCGMYSANSLRIFGKLSATKNIIPIAHTVFWGCPAADGTLLAPWVKRLFVFPKNIDSKIETSVTHFVQKLQQETLSLKLPRFKFYSILNYPNKLAGQRITIPIHLHGDKCSQCGICIANCPARALQQAADGYPFFVTGKCEKCYRCIHHCPRLALSLSKRKATKKALSFQ